MKTYVAALTIALATVASAQLDNIPQCALQCFIEPLTSDGCESLEDFKCHCEKADSLFAAVTPCVQGACEADDQAAVIDGVEKTCAAAGVPVQVPEPGASSAPGSTQTPDTTVVGSTQTPDTTVVATTQTPDTTVIESTVVASTVVETTAAATTGNSTEPSATLSSTVSEFTGAAAQATQAVGIIGAAALALLAL